MSEWALLVENKEICVYRGVISEVIEEDVQEEAISRGLAARLGRGLALAPGVEIVCYSDE